ncbi:MAG: ATP-binding protein, partial [Acidimicrobiia bacterium]
MLRFARIRTKLALTLAIPLLAFLGVAAYEAVSATSRVGEVRDQTDLARASFGPNSLMAAIQNERNLAGVTIIGLEGAIQLDAATNDEARAATDASLDQLRTEIDSGPADLRSAVADAFEAADDLDRLRGAVVGGGGPRDLSSYATALDVFAQYSVISEAFLDATSTLATRLDDAELRNGVEIIDANARQVEAAADVVRLVLLAQVSGTGDDPAARAEVGRAVARARAYEDEMYANMVGIYAPAAEHRFDTGSETAFMGEADRFVATGEADVAVMLAVVNSAPEGEVAIGPSDAAAEILERRAGEVLDRAEGRQRLFAGLAVLGVLLAALTTWLVSRSITRPLASLRAQAEDMARDRLPKAVQEIFDTPPGEDVKVPTVAPIEVATRDEVSEVAAALGTVQASALDLAAEQAVLRRNIADSFVNLGRRNQNLLNRQLDFITELERNEADPDSLDGLFRLDHLATRMRRNAESLLVLAGVDPPRQWSAPVLVADVVRAALGEVEDYQRVQIRNLEPVHVAGSAATDLAHALAELLENALVFSPPEQPVEVRGRLGESGYTLAVSDNGLGMSREDLDRANRRLRGEESFTVAPSRYLGHYVAGHLAARHGVEIELQENPAGGITARIDLPPTVIEAPGAPADPTTAPAPGGGGASVPGSAPAAAAVPPTSTVPAQPSGASLAGAGSGPAIGGQAVARDLAPSAAGVSSADAGPGERSPFGSDVDGLLASLGHPRSGSSSAGAASGPGGPGVGDLASTSGPGSGARPSLPNRRPGADLPERPDVPAGAPRAFDAGPAGSGERSWAPDRPAPGRDGTVGGPWAPPVPGAGPSSGVVPPSAPSPGAGPSPDLAPSPAPSAPSSAGWPTPDDRSSAPQRIASSASTFEAPTRPAGNGAAGAGPSPI